MNLNVHNLVKWFQTNYPAIVREMKDASHHYHDCDNLNSYHLEGDVWTHTMMVVLEASKINNDPNLLVAALLHDIGKPVARKENVEKKRVHFYGHEPISMFMAIQIIDHILLDFDVYLNKQLILEVISIHTDVYKFPRQTLEERLHGKRRLAMLLSKLSTADYNGRFYDSGERDMEPIITQPRSGRVEDFSPEGKKHLVCMIGLPCSGKSTYAAMFENYEVLSRDDIVMELGREMGLDSYNEAFKKCDQNEVNKRFNARRKELTQAGKNVILDMTNMSRKSRRRNMEGFNDYFKSAEVIMHNLEDIKARNFKREGKLIPLSVISKMMTSFYPPLYDEFDEINWIFT